MSVPTFAELRKTSAVDRAQITAGVLNVNSFELKTVAISLTEDGLIQSYTAGDPIEYPYDVIVNKFKFVSGDTSVAFTTIKLANAPTKEEVIEMGDGLHGLKVVNRGGEDGYFDFVFFLVSFMTCMQIEHESDTRKMIKKGREMSIAGKYTPVKPMLVAVSTQSERLKTLQYFIPKTAELAHSLTLFMNKDKIEGKVRDKLRDFVHTYTTMFGPVDRSVRAAYELVNDPEMADAMSQSAHEAAEKITVDPEEMVGLLDFDEKDLNAFQSFRKIVAIKNMKPGVELRDRFIKKEMTNNKDMVIVAQNQSDTGMMGNNGLYSLR